MGWLASNLDRLIGTCRNLVALLRALVELLRVLGVL